MPDFGNVDFILSTETMEKLGSVIDLEEKKIKIRKKSFVFKSCNMIHLKPGSVAIINVKSNIPKPLKNHSFICKPFAPYVDMLPTDFLVKFKSNNGKIRIYNSTKKTVTIKPNSVLGYATVTPKKNIYQHVNHVHMGVDKEIGFCSLQKENCMIDQYTYCNDAEVNYSCLLYTSPSPRDGLLARMPSSA